MDFPSRDNKEYLLDVKKQSEQIVKELKKTLTLFTDDLGNAHARIKNKDHYEIWPIAAKNRNFKCWVAYRGRKILNCAAAEAVIKEVITTLQGEAIYENDIEHILFNRVAITDDGAKYWYDLADNRWRAIEITSRGWRIVDQPPILFRRYQHQLPQVIPDDKNGNIKLFKKYLKLENEQDEILVYVFLVTALIADIPHVCLVLHGPQGSSKTTNFKMLRKSVDPSRLEVLCLRKNIRDLEVTLNHNWFCPFDNISGLKKEISDIFCQVITGTGFSGRVLYTDDEMTIKNMKRIICLNGINIAAAQPDLLERCLMIELRAMAKTERITERKLWSDFQKDLPKIFGGMLDILSKAMAIRPQIIIKERERMADFMCWGEAIARAMGYQQGEFLDAYKNNLAEINSQGLDNNYVAAAIKALVKQIGLNDYNTGRYDSSTESVQNPIWEGKPSELIDDLTSVALNEKIIADERDKFWPRQANAMSRQINRIKPILRAEGIEIETGKRTAIERKIVINDVGYQGVQDANSESDDSTSNTSSSSDDANIKPNEQRNDNDDKIDPEKIPF